MSAVTLEPNKTAKRPPCAWCGLRISAEVFQGTPCCIECRDGGRVFRVKMAMGRWKRLQQPRVVRDE